MATSNYVNISLLRDLIERLDEFLESKDAKGLGLNSRAAVLTMLTRDFLEKWNAESNDSKKIIKITK